MYLKKRRLLFVAILINTLLLPQILFASDALELKKFAVELQGKVLFENGAQGSLKRQDGTNFDYNVKFLAKGGFGDVFRISFETRKMLLGKKDSGSLVVKVIRDSAEDPTDRDAGLGSANVQKAIRNLSTFQKGDHFVKYFGTISDAKDRVGILIEGAGSDLKEIYIKKKETPLKYGDLFKQIARGIKFMHDLDYGHFDLKPANMLLGNDNLVKIIDTDDAEIASLPGKSPPVSISSLGYTAPEIYNQGFTKFLMKQNVDWRASDIYALGMTYLALLKRKDPIYLMSDVVPSLNKALSSFEAKKISADEYTDVAIKTVAEGKIAESLSKSPLNDNSPIFKLILKMLNPNPLKGNRVDISEVLAELEQIYPEP